MMVGKLFEDKTHIRVLKVVSIILGVPIDFPDRRTLYQGTETNLFSVMQFVSLFMTVAIVSYMIYAFLQWRSRPVAKIEPAKTAEPESIYVNLTMFWPKTKVFEFVDGINFKQIAGNSDEIWRR